MTIVGPNEQAFDDHDDDEPTTEELIEMLRESLRDVEEGRTRPARELLAELRAKQECREGVLSSN